MASSSRSRDKPLPPGEKRSLANADAAGQPDRRRGTDRRRLRANARARRRSQALADRRRRSTAPATRRSTRPCGPTPAARSSKPASRRSNRNRSAPRERSPCAGSAKRPRLDLGFDLFVQVDPPLPHPHQPARSFIAWNWPTATRPRSLPTVPTQTVKIARSAHGRNHGAQHPSQRSSPPGQSEREIEPPPARIHVGQQRAADRRRPRFDRWRPKPRSRPRTERGRRGAREVRAPPQSRRTSPRLCHRRRSGRVALPAIAPNMPCCWRRWPGCAASLAGGDRPGVRRACRGLRLPHVDRGLSGRRWVPLDATHGPAAPARPISSSTIRASKEPAPTAASSPWLRCWGN